MAPAAQPASRNGEYNGSRARFESLQAWFDKFGDAEYVAFRKDNASSTLSYEEWMASDHILGPYLWHTITDIWDEEDSTSDEASDVEAPEVISPRKQMPVRPKKVTTNGHGMRPTAKSSTSTPLRKSAEASTDPTKRKRKPKKQYLSQEMIASDDSDDMAEPTPVIEVAAPAPTPTATSNGRRKSGIRKKKQFLSEETISPLDEDEDPMSIDAVAVAPVDHIVSAAPTLESPIPLDVKKTTKRQSGKKSRRKYLSQEIVPLDDDEEDSVPPGVATPKHASVAASVASPDGPGSSSRRGLRTRTAAQQNPYQHHEKLFEHLISADEQRVRERSLTVEPSPKPARTSLAKVAYLVEEVEVPEEAQQDRNGAVLTEDVPSEELQPVPRKQGRVHYKGKGRAWKKTESDEDDDFKTLAKPKKGKLPAKNRLGRRKSTQLYATKGGEIGVRVTEEKEVESENSPQLFSPPPPQKKQKEPKPSREPKLSKEPKSKKPSAEPFPVQEEKKKRRPRKPKISAEFVQEDTDTEAEEQDQQKNNRGTQEDTVVLSSFPNKTSRPVGRPRKSDQSVSKDMMDLEEEDTVSPGRKKMTPRKPGSVIG